MQNMGKTMRNFFLKSSDQNGTAAVEFAIVLPLLVILFAGIIEFGLAYYNKQVITNASREGARHGTISKNSTAAEETAFAYAESRLITFGNKAFTKDSNITISPGTCISTSTNCTVSVSFKYNYFLLHLINFFDFNFDSDSDIGATTVMKMNP